jgi:hypothetical protein
VSPISRSRCVTYQAEPHTSYGAPGRNRTCDTRFRKPVLYPLSYEGRGPRARPTRAEAQGRCGLLLILAAQSAARAAGRVDQSCLARPQVARRRPSRRPLPFGSPSSTRLSASGAEAGCTCCRPNAGPFGVVNPVRHPITPVRQPTCLSLDILPETATARGCQPRCTDADGSASSGEPVAGRQRLR